MPRLVDEGFRVIAPDYRGAGNSSRPSSGYDKRTMASDIYRLPYEHLKLSSPVAMVGHDIGLMVASLASSTLRRPPERRGSSRWLWVPPITTSVEGIQRWHFIETANPRLRPQTRMRIDTGESAALIDQGVQVSSSERR
ncbi:alpha/beta fold hydrolase [Bradyrhizobium agreste]|uniref:alpha/beta fold hydrolase n=1 Tax=Bradyrhizobium agreste TaxID=2751811 RepID=UPI0028999612|nr:alpha/beta fold hydrolase [Bradyrhizobium agreste]